jgi:ATP-dependent DNA ligase
MAEIKLDGWRGIIHFDGERVRVYGGRNGSDYTGRVPYLEKELAEVLPPDSVVDGELIVPTGWGDVQSIMSTQRPHWPLQSQSRVQFYMFDVLRANGIDSRKYPWEQRRHAVEKFATGELVQPTVLLPATTVSLEAALVAGFEGLVIKDPKSPYVNARSTWWTKVKPQLTTEARITGFKPGKVGGEWDGKVGAFEIELLENGAKTTIKCGTNERHEDATDHPENWKGRIIEIKHHGLAAKTGVPRHPQFYRLRSDLEAA